jgi:mRNA (guanine-N7-)-methyltransferase
MHKCTIGVQLADEKRFQKLEPRHQKNSTVYCKFMRRLRKEGIAAVLSKDKHGRFAILMPMTSSTGSSGNSFDAEDCAAFCYIGEVREVMQSLAVSSNTATTSTITNTETSSDGLWQPPGQEENTTLEASETLWQPPGTTAEEEIPFSAPWQSDTGQESSSAPWEKNTNDSGAMLWDPNNNEAENNNKRGFDEINTTTEDTSNNNEFHADTGAAAADAFYSGLTRSLGTRADSRLYHMRSFNGWVKATQIAELDPKLIINGRPQTKRPLRVLDLACGKGGDLTKWSLHQRGMSTYW